MWYIFTKNYGKDFVSTVIPGFRPVLPPNEIFIKRSPSLFEERLNISYNFFEWELRLDTFNDFTELTNVEPSMRDAFSYLKTLKRFILSKIYQSHSRSKSSL
jgi:hypothetical protein